MSSFTYQIDEYIRQKQLLEQAIIQTATYVARMSGDPIEKCIEFIKTNIKPEGLAPIKDPRVHYLQRKKNGDREERETTFSEYLKVVYDNDLIMAPTMTVYLNPKQRTSILGLYITDNLAKRKVFKHKKFEYMMAGDTDKESFYDNLQNNVKIKNNSVSGAHASPSNPLYNKSSHSTLTSICRIATSYANANNECFLMGNRHYYNPNVVINSILSMLTNIDMSIPAQAVYKYNLYIPTVQDVIDCITYSSDHYWRDPVVLSRIMELVGKLTDVERACFVYNGDLYHLAKHNQDFVKTFLESLCHRLDEPIDNPDAYIKAAGEDLITMVTLICSKYMDGRQLKKVKEEDPRAYGIVAATAKKCMEVLAHYETLITGLWRNDLLPCSIANIPSIVRKAVITSDTDSTIFTNQFWTQWISNGENFSDRAYEVGYTTTFLTSQLVKHKLGLMSSNIGAIKEHIHKISMKNEFYFPVFGLTPVAKHYFAYRSAQEGNVFKKLVPEIKGVHLRNSAAPAEITIKLREYMEYLMLSLMSKGGLTLDEALYPVYDVEKDVIDDIRQGGFKYMKSVQVKDPKSYVKAEEAPNYKQYLFWEEIFAPKYGSIPPPPYGGISVSVDLSNGTKFNRWLTNMSDQELANRIRQWALRNGKRTISTIVIPTPILDVMDMPEEILDAIDSRKLIKTISNPFYLVLESLGIYMMNKNNTRLVYDLFEERSRRAA
jgi:hypothetical protein